MIFWSVVRRLVSGSRNRTISGRSAGRRPTPCLRVGGRDDVEPLRIALRTAALHIGERIFLDQAQSLSIKRSRWAL